jgi:hypothetical protein
MCLTQKLTERSVERLTIWPAKFSYCWWRTGLKREECVALQLYSNIGLVCFELIVIERSCLSVCFISEKTQRMSSPWLFECFCGAIFSDIATFVFNTEGNLVWQHSLRRSCCILQNIGCLLLYRIFNVGSVLQMHRYYRRSWHAPLRYFVMKLVRTFYEARWRMADVSEWWKQMKLRVVRRKRFENSTKVNFCLLRV